MVSGNFVRFAAAAAVCTLLAGCGGLGGTELSAADLAYAHSGRHEASLFPPSHDAAGFPGDDTTPSTVDGTRLQCVPYAREHSNVNIHGDAYTWWDKAEGVYSRGSSPIIGAVMVLNGYAGRHRAHVAVVHQLVSAREILINHANWLDDGAIYVNDPVLDVSDDNDWTQVKVWNIRSGSWGTKVYAVQGFIGPGTVNGRPVVAANDVPRHDPIARQIAASNADLGGLLNDSSVER